VVVEGSVMSTLGREVGLEVAMGPRTVDEEDRATPPPSRHLGKNFGRQKISEVAEKPEIPKISEISGQIQTNLFFFQKNVRNSLKMSYIHETQELYIR
jgi:hypothetical protein